MRIDGNSGGEARTAYVERINLAIDYVLAHLDGELKLEVVAEAAGLSPFHFHRVFRMAIGETLAQFVKRVRLERAITTLSHDPGRSLTEVALECGFGSSSDFSRSFKQRYGVPPSAFDVEVFRGERREDWEQVVAHANGGRRLERLAPGENPDGFEVELRTLPARTVAYVRVHDSYRPGAVEAAIERFVDWADARGLADGQWLGYMWDDPEVVAAEQCRYDIGLEVDDVAPEGEIGRIEFPPMLVAQLELRGTIDLEMRALDWIFRTWLPSSGYVPASRPCFEAWIGRPFAHGKEHFELYAQIPVELAR